MLRITANLNADQGLVRDSRANSNLGPSAPVGLTFSTALRAEVKGAAGSVIMTMSEVQLVHLSLDFVLGWLSLDFVYLGSQGFPPGGFLKVW